MPNGNLLMRIETPHRGGPKRRIAGSLQNADSYSDVVAAFGRLIRRAVVLVPAPHRNAIWEHERCSQVTISFRLACKQRPLLATWTPDGKNDYGFQAAHGVRSDIWAIREAATVSQGESTTIQ